MVQKPNKKSGKMSKFNKNEKSELKVATQSKCVSHNIFAAAIVVYWVGNIVKQIVSQSLLRTMLIIKPEKNMGTMLQFW